MGTEMNVRPLRDNLSNVQILNAVRKNASPDYQTRIPNATKANIQDVIQNLETYRPMMNEFVDVLINRIGLVLVRNAMWTNPYAKFKRGMLTYGSTIEEINVGLINARVYNTDRDYLEKDIFGQYRPDVQANYHVVNRQNYYPLSVNESMLKRAFIEDGGLQTFITALMTAPMTSDNWDEFLLMSSLFKQYDEANGFFNIQVPDITSIGSTKEDAQFFLKRAREMAGNLKFISSHYNASKMPVAANADDLELFITPEANASVDVDALAGAFNIDRAQMPYRINEIPKEHLGITDAIAILTTRDFFVVADTYLDTSSAINPVGRHTNYFLHHDQVISASRFVPALMFRTSKGDTIEIADTPVTAVETLTVEDRDGNTVTTVERGELYTVKGNAVTNGYNDALRFEIDGAKSAQTYINQARSFKVAITETADTLKIKGFAVDTPIPQLVGEVSVTVVGDGYSKWPEQGAIDDADKDGLEEVTPEAIVRAKNNTVTIPNVKGVQYKKAGAIVNNGTVHTITAPTTFTAEARSGFELATGATATWTVVKA